MSSEVFPVLRGLTYTVVKTPVFDTLIQKAPSKQELRIVQSAMPIWRWRMIFDYLYDQSGNIQSGLVYTDLQTLMGFFLSRQGSYDSFLFRDPDDYSVGPALISAVPNQAARLPVVTASGVRYTPIQRPMGGLTSAWNNANRFFEDITDGGSFFHAYANGVAKTSGTDFTFGGPGLSIPSHSYVGLYMQWTGTPNPTEPVTAEFEFYYRVRFASDEQDFEKFMYQLWTIGGSQGRGGKGTLEIQSVRPNTT